MNIIEQPYANHLRLSIGLLVLGLAAVCFGPLSATFALPRQAQAVQTVGSGPWSDPAVWPGGILPKAGDAVTIRTGDTIVYDLVSDEVLGALTLEGTLAFSRHTDTRLKLKGIWWSTPAAI
ncbi:MAG: G8 domain-containing protein [Caldilineaceae bacterium]